MRGAIIVAIISLSLLCGLDDVVAWLSVRDDEITLKVKRKSLKFYE